MAIISDAKLKANRDNSKRSTGPRTPRGKAISKLNAVKHGVFLKRTIAFGPPFKEDAEEVIAIFRGLVSHYEPIGVHQVHLVWTIADAMQKQAHLGRFHVAGTNARLTAAIDAKRRRHEGERWSSISERKSFTPYSDSDPARRPTVTAEQLDEQLELVTRLKRGEDINDDPVFHEFVWLTTVAEKSETSEQTDGSHESETASDTIDDERVTTILASLSPKELGNLQTLFRSTMEGLLDEMWRLWAETMPFDLAIEQAFIPDDAELNRIIRYENFLRRCIEGSIELLEHLQAASRPGR